MSPPRAGGRELRAPFMPSRFLHAAIRFLKEAPSVPRRQVRKRILRRAYLRGCTNPARKLPEEESDTRIIEAGTLLRRRVLDANESKHRPLSYRVLMLRPASITAELWFGGLHSCMQHAGIDCRLLPPGSESTEINQCIEQFQPNVLIATELAATLRSLDLTFIHNYKRRHGCLRLFVPVGRAGAPGGYSTAREDEWRRSLRRSGMTADAYFSIFEPEFYERFMRDTAGPGIEYVTVPQACNPFIDRPLPGRKTYDYFMAASLTPERLAVTYRFARGIMGRYRGLWAGPRWGFGRHTIPPEEMPSCYARTRIALSTLAGFVPRYAAELTHRVYAAAGCGAFQLTMPTAITSRYFAEDELVQAGSPEAYERLFDHYVDRPEERNTIALRALERTYRTHTCFDRVDKLVAHWNDWRNRGFF